MKTNKIIISMLSAFMLVIILAACATNRGEGVLLPVDPEWHGVFCFEGVVRGGLLVSATGFGFIGVWKAAI